MAGAKNNSVSSTLKVPPQNLEAEKSLLGSLLLEKDAILKVADILAAEDFYDMRHAEIYKAILALYEKRSPIDVLTLTDYLKDKKRLKEVGGSTCLAELVSGVVTSANLVSYAQIIAQKATLRRLIEVSSKLNYLGHESDRDVAMVMDEAEQELFNVSKKQLKRSFVPIKEILSDSFDRIEMLHNEKGSLRGIPTGFRRLDNILSGLQRSDLVILGARPSTGKTSLALNMALNAASQGLTVGVFSLEMSKMQLVERLLAAEARVDSWRLRTGNLSDDDFPRLGRAMGKLSEVPLYIDDSASLTAMQIRTKARRLQSEKGLDLIIIDYLQLMESSSRNESRVQEISEISRSLKGLARELDVPVLALSQLSRAVEQRPNKRPQLSDLRESGSIEQDADVVMFIYREDMYDRNSENPNIANIIVAKHRNGPTGEIDLYFQKETMQFKSVDPRSDEVAAHEVAPAETKNEEMPKSVGEAMANEEPEKVEK